MKTILRFASVSLKIIKTDLLGSWWPCQCVLPPKDVNRSSVIAKHVHRWFPVTVASQALTGQTIGRYTLWVLGFIEKQIGQRPQCKPLDSGSGGGVDSLRQTPTASPCAAVARSCSTQQADNNKFVIAATLT